MSVLVDYLSIALPVFGMTVMTLGGCMCCIWRRIDRRLSQFEEQLLRSQQQQQQQIQSQQSHTYYPPYGLMMPTAPPAQNIPYI
jgi:hypothetical protein